MIISEIAHMIIKNSVENGLSAIWSIINAKYDNIGPGSTGKKSPINPKSITIIQIIIRAISMYFCVINICLCLLFAVCISIINVIYVVYLLI